MSRADREDVRNEQVLARQLSAAQQAMMALGGAIGTGLFLASGLAVNVAGPAVIASYAKPVGAAQSNEIASEKWNRFSDVVEGPQQE
jgi:hypothetical protein